MTLRLLKWSGLFLIYSILIDSVNYLTNGTTKFDFAQNLAPPPFNLIASILLDKYNNTYFYLTITFNVVLVFLLGALLGWIYYKLSSKNSLKKKYSYLGAIIGYLVGLPVFSLIFSYLARKAIKACALKQGYVGYCDYGRGILMFVQTLVGTMVLIIILAIIGWIYGKNQAKKNYK